MKLVERVQIVQSVDLVKIANKIANSLDTVAYSCHHVEHIGKVYACLPNGNFKQELKVGFQCRIGYTTKHGNNYASAHSLLVRGFHYVVVVDREKAIIEVFKTN